MTGDATHPVAFAISAVVTALVAIAQPGPRWLWMVDACPESSTMCLNVPLGVFPAAAIGAAVFVVLVQVVMDDE